MPDPSTAFLASLGRWGFFQGSPSGAGSLDPRAATAFARGSLPDNVRDDPVQVPVAGLACSLQFFQVSLTSLVTGQRTEHVVVSAYPPVPRDVISQASQALLETCGSSALCLVLEDRAGWARVLSLATGDPRAVAAAIAHTKRTGGWDESDPIVVSVEAREFRVSARFDGESWQWVVRE
ncbi:MAG TPA: hypothetical protein VHM25_15225 [Polyangiaceae bacterium]|jgi:hypothetical protein|nr:hypothetical protein [Polyangiaceae bacterium]